MSKQKMLAARELIQEKRYAEARALLKTIDDPKAKEWLKKLDAIAPEKKKSGSNLILVTTVVLLLAVVIIAVTLITRQNNADSANQNAVAQVPTQMELPSVTPTFTETAEIIITATPRPGEVILPTDLQTGIATIQLAISFDETSTAFVNPGSLSEGTVLIVGLANVARSGPNADFEQMMSISTGERLPVIARTAGNDPWYLVILPNGKRGWVWGRIVRLNPPDANVEIVATLPPTNTPPLLTPSPNLTLTALANQISITQTIGAEIRIQRTEQAQTARQTVFATQTMQAMIPTPMPIPGCNHNDVLLWMEHVGSVAERINTALDLSVDFTQPLASAQTLLTEFHSDYSTIEYMSYPSCTITARGIMLDYLNELILGVERAMQGDINEANAHLSNARLRIQGFLDEVHRVLEFEVDFSDLF